MIPGTLDLSRIETDAAYHDDMRHRFITDFFFAGEVLGWSFHRSLHQPVADLHIRKNPALPIGEQDAIKNRMHLDPRYTWKTTGARVDKVQWVCAFPKDITILNETATQPLAKAISAGIAGYFYCPKYGAMTPFQRLFPELVTQKEPFGRGEDTWNTPLREADAQVELNDTLAFTSPQSVQSGWHPWIINADDMVETRNSGIRANPDIRQGVIDVFDTNKNTLVPDGYMYLTGTRYHPFDLYGVRLQDMDPERWKVLIRYSVRRKDGSRLVPGEFPPEDELEMPFADLPGMSYSRLREMFLSNYEAFQSQQNNDPQGGHTPVFDDKLYDGCETDAERVPAYGGESYTCWRLAHGGRPATNKFAEGAAARIIGGKVYVTDCWRFGGTPSHQAEMMVQMHKRCGAEGMMVYDTPGYEGMMVQLRNEFAKKNMGSRIQVCEYEPNEQYRTAQIKDMEPLLKVGRVLFVRGMTKGGDCRKQFVHFGLVEETGIVECVQALTNRIPLSQMRANMEEEELEWQRKRREDAMLNEFLSQQGMPAVDEQATMKARAHLAAMEAAMTHPGMPPLPGNLDG